MQSMLLACLLMQSPDMGEHLKAMESRLVSLQNVTVAYEETTASTPTPEMAEVIAAINADSAVEVATGNQVSLISFETTEERRSSVFRFASGNARYEDVGSKRTFVMESFLSDRHEMLYQWPQAAETNFQGYIEQPNNKNLPDSVIDCALGLRFFSAEAWLTPKSLKPKNIVTRKDDGLLQITFADPADRAYSHVWTVDPSHGYRLQGYDLIAHGVTEGAHKGDFVVKELRNISFANVQGVDLPERIELRKYFPADNETGRHQTQEVHLNVQHYRLNDLANSKEGLRVVWPIGTMVTDQRTGTPVEIASRAQALDDETLAKLANGESESEPPSSFSPRLAIAVAGLLATFMALAAGVYWTRPKAKQF